MKRYLLVGNYGAGNLGDELLKEYFLRAFPEVTLQVVSAHPKDGELPRLPGGVRSFFAFRWVLTLRALRRSDGLVFGGGSLFTDAESVRACVLWGTYALAARTFRKPYFLAFQGVGPFRTVCAENVARWVSRNASFVSVRDSLSLFRVQRWDLNKKVIQTFDPVLSLITDESKPLRSKNILMLIPRKHSSAAFQKRSLELRSQTWDDVRTLSLEEGPSPVRSLSDFLNELSCAAYVLTERYHAALIAFALGIPFEVVPQQEGDKLDALRRMQMDSLTCRFLVSQGEQALHIALGS